VEEKFTTSRDACLLNDDIPSVYIVNLLNILIATEVSCIAYAYPREFLVITVSADSIESQKISAFGTKLKFKPIAAKAVEDKYSRPLPPITFG